MMDFSKALRALRAGHKVTRWARDWLELTPGGGGSLTVRLHSDRNSSRLWQPVLDDILAEDWRAVT